MTRSNLIRATHASLLENFWLALLLCCLTISTAQAVTLELDQADFVLLQSNMPPAENAAWSSLKLPDYWNKSRPGVGGDGWYRIRFALREVPSAGQAVYLPRLCMNAAVYLNGMFLGDGGKFSDPVARNWNRPLLFLIPPNLLQQGENTLLIRVHSPAYSLGSLAIIQIGTASDLRSEYEKKIFWQITINQVITLIVGAMGLFMLALWHRRRQDTMYGFLGLSTLVWSFNSSNLFVQTIPISAHLWEMLVSASFQVYASLLLISLLRFLGLQKPWFEKLLWLILIASPANILLTSNNWFIPVSMIWHLATMFSSMAVCWYLFRAAMLTPKTDTLALAGALGLGILFGVHDWLKLASILQNSGTHLLQYAAPMFFIVVGGVMTNRFVFALNQLEQLNSELEQRVQAKHAALETQYANMKNMEKQRATMEERNRIYRDLHDDMGAKLLGLVISAQRANLPKEADLARSALQDLRDVVSRSAQAATPLSDLLADLRTESVQRVKSAGLALDWRFPEPANFKQLNLRQSNVELSNENVQEIEQTVGAEVALNLSRILREAVTNVLRHAEAKKIIVTTKVDENYFHLSIEDDGIGFATEAHKSHRGMSGMQTRAAALNGTLQWESVQPHGCRVKFSFPLTSPNAASQPT